MDKKTYLRESLVTFSKMSAWIVGPVLVALFLGKWIDMKFNFAPYGLISIIGFSFLASCFGIVKEAKKYLKTLDEKKK